MENSDICTVRESDLPRDALAAAVLLTLAIVCSCLGYWIDGASIQKNGNKHVSKDSLPASQPIVSS